MNRRDFLKAGVGIGMGFSAFLAGCDSSLLRKSEEMSTKIIHPKFFTPKEDLLPEKLMNVYELAVYDVNSQSERRITNNNLADGLPIFSQDGKSAISLRFDGKLMDENCKVMKVNLENLAEEDILSFKEIDEESAKKFPKFTGAPPFFPLSSWINDNEILHDHWLQGIISAAFGVDPKEIGFIHKFNVETKKFEKLFDTPGRYYFSRVSPDKKKIVYSSVENPEDKDAINLYVSNTDGSKKEKITDYKWDGRFKGRSKEQYLNWLKGMAILPSWSPDGKEIAYVSIVTGNFEIFKVNLNNGKKTQLTSGEEENWLPIWAKDGIYFIRKQNIIPDSEEFKFLKKAMSNIQEEVLYYAGKREIWKMDCNGKNQRKIVDTTMNYFGTFDVYPK